MAITIGNVTRVIRSGTTVAVTVPAGVVDGDLLLMTLTQLGVADVPTLLAGWTVVDTCVSDVDFDAKQHLWMRIADSEPASYTVTFGASQTFVSNTMMAFGGVDPDAPINTKSVNSQQVASSTPTGLTITPTVDNCLILWDNWRSPVQS